MVLIKKNRIAKHQVVSCCLYRNHKQAFKVSEKTFSGREGAAMYYQRKARSEAIPTNISEV